MATTMLAPTMRSTEPSRPRWARRAWFWVRRYGPAEIACLITMLAASILAAQLTDSPPLLAVAAIAGATVGFYGVLLTTVMREQLALLPVQPGRIRRASIRTVGLLAAEFGVAEVSDTFVIRPALMILGVILVRDAVWGLLLGKVVADVLFYVVSGVCFRITQRTGIRLPRLRLSAVSPARAVRG
jgi:hypothetical protein